MARTHIDLIDSERRLGAHNYKPLDVVLCRGKGVWVWDVDGNRYLDCLAAYSAVNQGHSHPRILAALTEQAGRLAITSRAFRNDQLALYYEELAALTGAHKILPMNSGAEAVECVHHVRDVHVTLLRLLGLDDNKLTYFHGGRFKQISQFGGSVINELIG